MAAKKPQNNNKAKQIQAYQQALKRAKPFVIPNTDKKIVVALGYGSASMGRAYEFFKPEFWHEIRVDADETIQADIVAQPYEIKAIADASVDGVFISHVLHRYGFIQAQKILEEALRILKDEGMIMALVPDLQLAATYVANDELEQAVYNAPVGGITAIDMMFGFQRAIRSGDTIRQHFSGYTMTSFGNFLRDCGFCNLKIQKRANDLFALAYKLPYGHPERVERIIMQTDEAERPKAPQIANQASNAQPTAIRFADLLETEPQLWKPLNLRKN